MSEQRKSEIDKFQSDQYSFPYHYLPNVKGFPNFSKGWAFSASYIAAINLFIDWLKNHNTRDPLHLHMDYGCGDGGFVYNVKKLNIFNNIQFSGIDFDENAINWARQFSQSEQFICGDVADLPASEYDSGSLIEVYEHIPPSECSDFLKCLARSLKKNAPVFITVPSTQKEVEAKHYRHFSFDMLIKEFGEYFVIEEIFGFERKNKILKIIEKISRSNWWFIETKFTNWFIINTLQSKYAKIDGCGRIGLIVRKK